MAETTIHLIMPPALPHVFSMRQYENPPKPICKTSNSVKIGKESHGTFDPEAATCKRCRNILDAPDDEA